MPICQKLVTNHYLCKSLKVTILMSKIGLIIKTEYKTRVAKKSFIILTFLMPLLFVAIILVPVWLSSIKDKNEKQVAVVDQVGKYDDVFKDFDAYKYEKVNQSVNQIKDKKQHGDFYAIVVINKDLSQDPEGCTIYSDKQVNMDLIENVKHSLTDYVENEKLNSYNIPQIRQIIKDSKVNLDINTIKWNEEGGEEESSTEMATIIGMIFTILIYMFIFTSGSQVMGSVVQEKVNRIVEVMICSVKPMQLMMGKIISIALVTLTQMFMWVVMTMILFFAVSHFTGIPIGGSEMQQMAQSSQGMNSLGNNEDIQKAFQMISTVNWFQIVVFFIIYFIGGYLMYASMFAAVGSAVDNETDTGQFMMPITLVVLFALYAGIYSAQNPDGPLAFWASMIPISSPIVMMVRIPFGVPAWQLILSVGLLFLTFLGVLWLSAKIYRVGILMYGKKITWKELFKWIKY